MRQVHHQEMDLAFHPADNAKRFAKIHLGMTGRMRQRHKHLPLTPTSGKDVVLHNRDATGEPVLVSQALKDPLCGMALLLGQTLIGLKDLIDDAGKPIKLGAPHRLRAPVARRHRERHHLVNRATVNAKDPCRLTMAHTLNDNSVTYPPVQLHSLHPRPLTKARRLTTGVFLLRPKP